MANGSSTGDYVTTRRIAGDAPDMAAEVRDRHAMHQRRERIDRMLQRLLDVPPPEGYPTGRKEAE